MVKNYKNCDDIWIFYAENIILRTDNDQITSEKLKVVACDKKLKEIYQADNKNIRKADKNINFDDGEN